MNENKLDIQDIKDLLDENTKKVYFSKLCYGGVGSYDPSVFVEAIQDDTGNLSLYVPARKRMAWFKTDFPNGLVTLDAPIFSGRRVTIIARLYKTPEDYKNNVPAAVNMATRPMDDKDPFIIDVCATRAQSRVLRDMGYDIPRDAHFIKGWTPVRSSVKKPSEDDLDALESSVVIKGYASDLEPKVGENNPEQEVAHEAMPEPAETTPDTATAANTADDSDKKPKATTRKAGRPKKNKAAEAEPVEAPAVSSEVSQEKAAPEAGNDAGEQDVPAEPEQKQTASVDAIAARAQQAFPTIGEAEAYTSRLLGGKTVGEQNDLRIRYFAEKAMKEDCRDEKLGLAAYLVATQRGIAL